MDIKETTYSNKSKKVNISDLDANHVRFHSFVEKHCDFVVFKMQRVFLLGEGSELKVEEDGKRTMAPNRVL